MAILIIEDKEIVLPNLGSMDREMLDRWSGTGIYDKRVVEWDDEEKPSINSRAKNQRKANFLEANKVPRRRTS